MSTSYWLDRSSKTPSRTADVVIVGGGITGLSTAYWLKKEDPKLDVVIVEKSRIGFGASGRNAGFITCGSVEHFNRMYAKHGKDEALEIWRFSEQNLRLLKENIIQDRGASVDFIHKGTFSLAAQESEFTELKSAAQLMRENNIGVEVLDANATEKRLGTTGFAGGIKYLDDANVHPAKLLDLINKQTSATILEQTEVYGVESAPGSMRHVLTDNGVIETPIVIYTLNGYLPTLHKYFADKVYPTRGQILVTEPVEQFMEAACYANFYLDYFRQLPDGRLLIGGFRQLEKETEVGYSDHTTEIIQNALHSFVDTHLPRMKGKKIEYRWAGIMGFSRDGQPMIGSLPDDQQVYFCGAYTGHGMGLAFNTSRCLVDLIFGREVPAFISGRRFQ